MGSPGSRKLQGTLLVLGASSDQLFLVRTAQNMGLRVLAVDMNERAPGLTVADESAIVSTRDVTGLKRLIDDRRSSGTDFAGVTTMGSDIPHVVAEVAEYLGTPSVSAQSAAWTTDKYAMKCRLREQGIPVPDFMEIRGAGDLDTVAESLGFPMVIKPVDRSGARGVYLVEDPAMLEALYPQSRDASFSGTAMAERFIPGLQISTETIMYQGSGETPGFADRNYEYLERFAPRIIENGGLVPSALSEEERAVVENLVVASSRALGVRDGVTKGDVGMSDSGPLLIEMATRLSGGDFSESLVPLSSGVNYVEAAVCIAVGAEPDMAALRRRETQAVANRYFFPEPGVLREVTGLEAVRAQPWVKKLETWYEVGEVVPEISSHAARFGVFVVVGADRDEVCGRARWVYDTVTIVTEPGRHA